MTAQGYVYKIMATAPFFLLGSLAAQSRLHIDAFDPAGCTNQQQADIAAYISPVRMTSILRVGVDNISHDQVLKVANYWITGAQSRKLKPLEPAFYDDTVRSNVKSQIKTASDLIINTLNRDAEINLAKNPWRSVQDHVVALKVAEILKYSDPYAVAFSGVRERNILRSLTEVAGRLHLDQKRELSKQIEDFSAQQQPIEPLVRQTRKFYQFEQQRMSNNELAPYNTEEAVAVSLAEEPSVTAVMRQARNGVRGHVPAMDHPYLGQLRMAYASQEHLKEMTKELLQDLRKGEPSSAVSL